MNSVGAKKDVSMTTNHHIYKALIGLVNKLCLAMLLLFIFGTIQGQKITTEHQLKMLKMNLKEKLPISYFDSLIIPPSTIEFNHKRFVNDTIEKPININEITTISFEKKVIMVSSPNGVFLFQIKKKFVEENVDGIIEHYYCTNGNRLYLIIIVKSGVYIRKDNSYYSSFFYHEEL